MPIGAGRHWSIDSMMFDTYVHMSPLYICHASLLASRNWQENSRMWLSCAMKISPA